MDNNNMNEGSGVNTVLLVIILLIVVGAVVWWVSAMRAPAPAVETDRQGIDVQVDLPDYNGDNQQQGTGTAQ